MSLLFELEQQQKLVIYAQGNQIYGVRLPLRRGGAFLMREGYLSDLTGVIYRGNIRLAWHSLEHHVILSGTEDCSDRIVLSDGLHKRQYGGLQLFIKDQELWILYSAKEPDQSYWQVYVQKLEEEMGEPIPLPQTFEKRPAVERLQTDVQLFVILTGEDRTVYEWSHASWIPWRPEKAISEEWVQKEQYLQKQMEEKDRQIAYIQNEYEDLRQIAMKLQEDGRRMKTYIEETQKKRKKNT